MDAPLDEYLKTRTRHTEGGCIEFTNKPNAQGYGSVAPKGKLARFYGERLVHRISWTHHNGPIPKGLCVMHSCDNRICCNINHLSVGTWADNNKDRKDKGRNHDTRGSGHPSNKLTEDDVLYIRSVQGNISARELANSYGMCYSTIYYIWNRKLWSHI